jgi:arabinogalactan endo-1,4-beta-galactosidase
VLQDLDYTLALARRIEEAGAQLLLDFHYSDTWADPGHQHKPAAWADLPFDELVAAVEAYTRDTLRAMGEAGVMPEYVQVGNEITPGMLWPDGKLHNVGDPAVQWRNVAELLRAGVRGVREAQDPDSPIGVVLHIDKGGRPRAARWFFEQIEAHGVPYDIIGLSFYPFWHGRLEDLQRTVHSAAEIFRKPVWVVETAYPWREFRTRNMRPENVEFPMTPEGQRDFLTAVVEIVRTAPHGLGLGVQWWYPESIRVPGLHIWNGGSTALFDADGNILPAAAALRP